jgi:MFS superfamily sulfate permease-like transporter
MIGSAALFAVFGLKAQGVATIGTIFASKSGYDIDADREFAALGASQIASAVSQGFCVGSLDSGAAVMDTSRGRTQLAGLISVATIVVVVSLCMQPVYAAARLRPERLTRRYCDECSLGHD